MRLKITILTLGAILMVYISGCSGSIKYERYLSNNPDLGLSVDYISGWAHDVQYGSLESFVQVIFYEPKAGNKISGGMMVLTIRDKNKLKIVPPTIDGIKDDLVKKRFYFKEPKLLSTSKIKLFGQEAIELAFSYKAIDSFDKRNAQFITMKEKVMIFERNDKFYIFRYENLAADFDKDSKAFDHIVRSIKFK